MQINIFSPNYKKYFLYLGWVLLFVVLFFRGCQSSEPDTKQIKIKEVTRTLPANTKIKHVPVEVPKWYRDTSNKNKYLENISESKLRIISYQKEIDSIRSEYDHSDSLQKAKLYAMATELKKFESKFEDENIKLTIFGIIGANEVKEFTPTYTIKEKKIDVPLQKRKIGVLTGVFLANDTQLQKPLFGAELGIENKKGNLLKIAFDSEKRIYLGYSVKLF